MIEARHDKHVISVFNWYIHRIINKHFHTVKYIDCGYKKPEHAILAIGNHMSWWDGFWLYEMNRIKINKRFHIIMLFDQLKNHMYFNKIGAAGLKKNSRNIVTMLKYCSGLMQQADNILFYFPEGEIRPQNQTHVAFEKGVMRIINDSPGNLQLLFVVNLTEYFSNKKPSLFTFYKSYEPPEFESLIALQNAYNQFMQECKTQLNSYSQ